MFVQNMTLNVPIMFVVQLSTHESDNQQQQQQQKADDDEQVTEVTATTRPRQTTGQQRI